MTSLQELQERLSLEYEKIRDYYAATGFTFPFELFIAGFALLALLISFVLIFLNLSLFEVAIAFVAIMSFAVSIPISIRENRIAEVEANLPDALKHMALVLKAGGTVENALEEVATPDGYGSLGSDLKKALFRLRRGQSFEVVLTKTADESGSLLLRRTASIIVDARRAGAGLADVLFAISDDAKDVLHIQRERLSRTVMHAIFIAAASIIIATFIFGFALSVINFIVVNMLKALPSAKPLDVCALNTTFVVFLMSQALIATIALGIVRFGKGGKYLLYIPVLILVSLLIFEGAKWASNSIVGGVGLIC